MKGDPPFSVRRATVDDIDDLVVLRAAKTSELSGSIDDDALLNLRGATRAYLLQNLPTGQFVAYVAEGDDAIVAASGMVFLQRLPTPGNLSGLDAYVLNMYTRPAWRGRGIASDLIARLIRYVREETGAGRMFLRAEPAAKPIYERAGFSADQHVMAMPVRRGE